MTSYVTKFDKDTRMSLRVNDKQLLKNYNQIWEKGWKSNEDKFWKLTFLW